MISTEHNISVSGSVFYTDSPGSESNIREVWYRVSTLKSDEKN